MAEPCKPGGETSPLAAIRLRCASSQCLLKKTYRLQRRTIDIVQAARIHHHLVGLRVRYIERRHPTTLAERMLGHAGLERIDRQIIILKQQFKIGGKERVVQNSLLRADRATALREMIHVDIGGKPHPPAITATFARFQHYAPGRCRVK